MEFRRKFNLENSPPPVLHSVSLPCVPAPANQHRVRISSSANHRPRLCFKDLYSWTSSLFKLSCDDQPCHDCSSGLPPQWPLFPRLSSGQVESTLTTPPILPLSVVEVALPPPWLLPAGFCSGSPLIFLTNPGFNVFFSSHPTFFPALFISSMDSLQHPISSLTWLLRELASNSATSALPLLRSADVQPALRPLPLTFTITMLVLARL
ncbi:hypothetical protein CRENBAI_020092 [Crenichthys baileyi]|uniref:Uncharacterized protein n=1 Tax=Crenichthys baileyi TaxID=28760 RepID=A0AAV9RBW2_9TELE